MIPTIGVIVAAYIITRMVQVLFDDDGIVVKLFACITILVSIIGALSLLAAGAAMPK